MSFAAPAVLPPSVRFNNEDMQDYNVGAQGPLDGETWNLSRSQHFFYISPENWFGKNVQL